MDHSLRRLYEDLRSIAVAVVYPPGEDRDLLVEQLKRIGCRIHLHWPFPDCPPAGADVVFFLVSQCGQNSAAWSSSEADATLIALSDYETPTTLKQLLKTNAHGVLTRPFRSAGILSTLVLARSAKLFQNRQQNKIDKLEGTIKARRVIEKAIRALMDNQRVDEREAYEHMRSRATRLRVSVAEVAAMIVEASEAMENSAWAARRRAPGTAENQGRPHMKVLIARMNHETNTFSPVPTPLSAFGNDGPTYDAAAYEENKGKRTAMSAFIDLAEAHGAGLVTPVSATAYPSGRVDGAAYRELCDRIVAAAPGCDALLLDLHGAMAVETTDDGEGDLLERLRRAAPGVPVAVALDLHGNVTQKMVDNADVIISFKTYPHVDMYETGEHAGRILFDWLAGGPRPALAWRRLPLMTHTLRSATAEGAMREAVQAARQAEQGRGAGRVGAGRLRAGRHPRALPERGGGGRGRGRTRGRRARRYGAGRRHLGQPRRLLLPQRAPGRLAGARGPAGRRREQAGAAAGSWRQLHVGRHLRHHGRADGGAGRGADRHPGRAVLRSRGRRGHGARGPGATVELPVGNKRPIDAIGRAAAPVTRCAAWCARSPMAST